MVAAHPRLNVYPDAVRWHAELPLMPVQQFLGDGVRRLIHGDATRAL